MDENEISAGMTEAEEQPEEAAEENAEIPNGSSVSTETGEEGDTAKTDAGTEIDAAVRRRVERDVAEISKIDGTVSSLHDITACGNYPQILSLVKLGLSIPQAYKAVNFERLIKEAEIRGACSAEISRASRAHLRKTEMRGAGGTDVPDEVMNEYRAFCPELSDAEIRKHYGRYVSRVSEP